MAEGKLVKLEKDGIVGDFHESNVAACMAQGWREPGKAAKAPAEGSDNDFSKWKVDELTEALEGSGVEIPDGAKKADLVLLAEEHIANG